MNCHLLSSLRTLRDWAFAFVMALLPQHLIAQLGNADVFPTASYAAHAETPHVVPVANAATASGEAPPSAEVRDPGASATQAGPAR